MSAKCVFHHTLEPVDPVVQYGYPTTVSGFELLQNENGTIHIISNPGVPTTGTEFANAPNGSRYFDETNGDLWIKTKAVGSGIDGVWTKASP
jgi:hypothetical protein